MVEARSVNVKNTTTTTTTTVQPGRPGGSVGNLETFWGWDVSSNLGVVTRTGIFPHIKNIRLHVYMYVRSSHIAEYESTG